MFVVRGRIRVQGRYLLVNTITVVSLLVAFLGFHHLDVLVGIPRGGGPSGSRGFVGILTSKTTTQDATSSTSTGNGDVLSSIRPTGLRLAIVGDSTSRFMYLSLVYFLAFGHWAPRGHRILENAKDEGSFIWNDWLAYSNSVLSSFEDCDCYRYWNRNINWDLHCEDRYFATNISLGDNHVSFITKFGKYPFHGHWDATEILSSPHLGLDQTRRSYRWKFDSWSELIDHHIARLTPTPNLLLFNQGRWGSHDLRSETVLQSIQAALDRHGIRGVYRTTNFRADEPSFQKFKNSALHHHDFKACEMFDCLNVSWTASLNESDYVDTIHLKAPPSNRMSLQFLKEILGLPVPEDAIDWLAEGGDVPSHDTPP